MHKWEVCVDDAQRLVDRQREKEEKYSSEPDLSFYTKREEQRKHRATLCVQAPRCTFELLLADATFTHPKKK